MPDYYCKYLQRIREKDKFKVLNLGTWKSNRVGLNLSTPALHSGYMTLGTLFK